MPHLPRCATENSENGKSKTTLPTTIRVGGDDREEGL